MSKKKVKEPAVLKSATQMEFESLKFIYEEELKEKNETLSKIKNKVVNEIGFITHYKDANVSSISIMPYVYPETGTLNLEVIINAVVNAVSKYQITFSNIEEQDNDILVQMKISISHSCSDTCFTASENLNDCLHTLANFFYLYLIERKCLREIFDKLAKF